MTTSSSTTRKFATRLSALALVAATAGLLAPAPTPATAAEIVGRLSFHWGPKHPAAIQAEKFAKRVNERGAGKIKIQTFP